MVWKNGRVPAPLPPPDRVRLDIWLDVACLFRTRSEAQMACRMGRIEVNGQPAKAHRELKTGEVIDISRPPGRHQRLIVKGLADAHIAKAEARLLYEDITPPPTAEEQALREMLRLARPTRLAAGTPDRDQKRTLRRLKEQG